MSEPDRVMIFDLIEGRAARLSEPITAMGSLIINCDRPDEAIGSLRRERPSVAVIVEADPSVLAFEGLAEAARSLGVATLAVVEPGDDPRGLAARVLGYTSWVSLGSSASELSARIGELIGRGGSADRQPAEKGLPAIDARFLALVVHDLRTPLNVIGLTIRAITQMVPQRSAELDEDLTFLKENALQIEKMLAQLGDYCRLIEGESKLSAVEFEARRFLSDFVEDRRGRSGAEAASVQLEFAEEGPVEVALDPNKARLALQHALANAITAAGESPVRLRSGGGNGRWLIEMIVDKPPPFTVETMNLRPDRFERLAGSVHERRGLDLSIAARVSELFGGSARLEVEPGRKSTVILDWPQRLALS